MLNGASSSTQYTSFNSATNGENRLPHSSNRISTGLQYKDGYRAPCISTFSLAWTLLSETYFFSISGLTSFNTSVTMPQLRPGTVHCHAASAFSHLFFAVPLKQQPQRVDTTFSWSAANMGNSKHTWRKTRWGNKEERFFFFLNYFYYYYFPAWQLLAKQNSSVPSSIVSGDYVIFTVILMQSISVGKWRCGSQLYTQEKSGEKASTKGSLWWPGRDCQTLSLLSKLICYKITQSALAQFIKNN